MEVLLRCNVDESSYLYFLLGSGTLFDWGNASSDGRSGRFVKGDIK